MKVVDAKHCRWSICSSEVDLCRLKTQQILLEESSGKALVPDKIIKLRRGKICLRLTWWQCKSDATHWDTLHPVGVFTMWIALPTCRGRNASVTHYRLKEQQIIAGMLCLITSCTLAVYCMCRFVPSKVKLGHGSSFDTHGMFCQVMAPPPFSRTTNIEQVNVRQVSTEISPQGRCLHLLQWFLPQVALVSWGKGDKSLPAWWSSLIRIPDFHMNLFRVIPFPKSVLGNDTQDEYAPLKFLDGYICEQEMGCSEQTMSIKMPSIQTMVSSQSNTMMS